MSEARVPDWALPLVRGSLIGRVRQRMNTQRGSGRTAGLNPDWLAVSTLLTIHRIGTECAYGSGHINDGLFDDDETNVYNTNPDKADTDGDGPDDDQEVFDGTDPLDPNDP